MWNSSSKSLYSNGKHNLNFLINYSYETLDVAWILNLHVSKVEAPRANSMYRKTDIYREKLWRGETVGKLKILNKISQKNYLRMLFLIIDDILITV